MKRFIFLFFIFSLLLMPLSQLSAQSSESEEIVFPQWARDLRRWNIISFGVFPFSMFFTTFAYDMYRWNRANGMDITEAGRRYAPWPLKSAGAVEMTSSEVRRTVLIAAGVSVAVAAVDLLIVRHRRARERRRLDARPAGTVVIERIPLFEENYEETDTYNDDENGIENNNEPENNDE